MYLKKGYESEEVGQLQRDLNFCAYDAGDVDGDFGGQTKSAVIALQSYHGLDQDGIYGDLSDNALMSEIKEIQQILVNNGYNISVDGAVGDETINATTAYQSKNGLVADGIVGAQTLDKLGLRENTPAPTAQAPTPITGNVSAPSGDLSGKVICINPGHGGSDPGACGDLLEKDMNLIVSLRLGQLLSECGAQVHYTRTTDIWMALGDRPAIANSVGADIFISIHHNGSSNPNSSYSLAICYPGSDNGVRLGQNVLNGIVNRLGLQNQGIIQRDDSDVTYSDMPAVITEAMFASSPDNCALFNNGGAELEALGILDGVLAYFG